MPTRSDKWLSQTYKVKRAKEVLDLSEDMILRALRGQTNLTEKEKVALALELYKKRIPSSVEKEETQRQLTVIKVVKNHNPEQIEHISEQVDNAVEAVIVDAKEKGSSYTQETEDPDGSND